MYSEQARLHFVKFETKYIENCLDFISDNLVNCHERKGKSIKATGGGAYKYSKLIQNKLGLEWVVIICIIHLYSTFYELIQILELIRLTSWLALLQDVISC